MDKTVILSFVLAAAAAAEACTSWVITPGSSASGRMMLQKCRDSRRSVLEAEMMTPKRGFRVMRIGTRGITMFGLNEKGVAYTSNNGDTLIKRKGAAKPEDFKAGKMLSGSANAEQLAARAAKFYRENRGRNPGGIYYIADPAQAFMMDVGDGYVECRKFTSGVSVIANSMHLPGNEEFSTQALRRIRVQRAREANTRAALAARRVGGKYTLRGTLDTSRLSADTSVMEKILPFRTGSVGGVCFELDPEFPEMLSCAYIALGPQRHTVYLPTPMALAQFPDKIRNGEWGERAFRLQGVFGFGDYKELDDITRLEDGFIAEFDAAREEARKLLRGGRRDEAAKLLNACYMRHYQAADKLLDDLDRRYCQDRKAAKKGKKAAKPKKHRK